jgi:hypothetical protein
MTTYTDGKPITITNGYPLRDVALACLAGLIAGFVLTLGVVAYVGCSGWCVR